MGDPGEVHPVAAPALVAWASRDVSRSGIMGDATVATAEKGERWIERGSAELAEAILEVCRIGQAQAS
jgi:creatinine amidohydrolase